MLQRLAATRPVLVSLVGNACVVRAACMYGDMGALKPSDLYSNFNFLEVSTCLLVSLSLSLSLSLSVCERVHACMCERVCASVRVRAYVCERVYVCACACVFGHLTRVAQEWLHLCGWVCLYVCACVVYLQH